MAWYNFFRAKRAPATLDDVIKEAGLDPLDIIYAGGVISRDKAATMTAVHRCINLIAGACASSMIDSLRAIDFETKKVIKNNSAVDRVIRTLIDSPDGFTPALTWIEDAMTDLLASGSAVMVIDKTMGGRSKLTLANPLSAYANISDAGRVSFTLQRDDALSGENAIYPESQVIIARWPRLSGRSGGLQARSKWFGTPPIQTLRNAIALSLGAEKWASMIFDRKSGAIGSDYAISFANSLSPTAQENLHRMLSAFAGGRSPLVLDGDARVTKMGVTAADAQLQDLRKYQTSEVARVFGVPSVLINQEGAGNVWGSSIHQLEISFLRYSVRLHLNRLLEALSYRLLPAGARLVVDESRAYRGDAGALTSIIGAARPNGAQPGVITRSELRSLFGLEDEYRDDWGLPDHDKELDS